MATRKSTTKTSTSKTTAKKTTPTKTAAAPVTSPEASLVSVMKKKEFVEKVAEASGQKKGVTRKVVEAALRELGDALMREDDLQLPPLGKITLNRQHESGGAQILVAKIRRSKAMMGLEGPATEAAADAVAETADSAADS